MKFYIAMTFNTFTCLHNTTFIHGMVSKFLSFFCYPYARIKKNVIYIPKMPAKTSEIIYIYIFFFSVSISICLSSSFNHTHFTAFNFTFVPMIVKWTFVCLKYIAFVCLDNIIPHLHHLMLKARPERLNLVARPCMVKRNVLKRSLKKHVFMMEYVGLITENKLQRRCPYRDEIY